MRVGLVLESGEPREVHHFALLVGYGCLRDQPVPRLRDDRRHDRQGHLGGRAVPQGGQELRQGDRQGHRQDDGQDGHLDHPELPRRADLRGRRPQPALGRRVLHRHPDPHRGHRPVDASPRRRCCATGRAYAGHGQDEPALDSGGDYQWRKDGEYHLFNPETIHLLQKACRTGSYAVFKQYADLVEPAGEEPLHPARAVGFPQGQAGADRGSRTGRGDRQALQDRRDELRVDQPGSARGAGDRHEPPRRQVQHRRRRRGPGAFRAAAERRQQVLGHQAGGLRPLRRDQQLPGQRARDPDQDGPGRQARRRRRTARPQGLSVDRQDPPLDARRRPDLAAAAPRHLLDRGPRRVDPRPQERQPRRPHQRQAGLRGRRRHHRRRRRQGACRRGADLRLRRRHRRLAAVQHQACRHPVGTRPWPKPTRRWCSTTCAAASASRPTASCAPAATWRSPPC